MGGDRVISRGGRVDVRLEVNSPVGKLPELSSLLHLGSRLGILYQHPSARPLHRQIVMLPHPEEPRAPAAAARQQHSRNPRQEETYVFGIVTHDCGVWRGESGVVRCVLSKGRSRGVGDGFRLEVWRVGYRLGLRGAVVNFFGCRAWVPFAVSDGGAGAGFWVTW